LFTSDNLQSPAATCGRNHRHYSRVQIDECEARFVARATLKRETDAKILLEAPALIVKAG